MRVSRQLRRARRAWAGPLPTLPSGGESRTRRTGATRLVLAFHDGSGARVRRRRRESAARVCGHRGSGPLNAEHLARPSVPLSLRGSRLWRLQRQRFRLLQPHEAQNSCQRRGRSVHGLAQLPRCSQHPPPCRPHTQVCGTASAVHPRAGLCYSSAAARERARRRPAAYVAHR